MKLTRENLVRVLAELAEADPVKELRRLEITGKQDYCNQCPVAKYLADSFECGTGNVYVDCDVASVGEKGVIGKLSADLPESIRKFISDFDAGNYPDLVSKED